jgi:hypothetical protein
MRKEIVIKIGGNINVPSSFDEKVYNQHSFLSKHVMLYLLKVNHCSLHL